MKVLIIMLVSLFAISCAQTNTITASTSKTINRTVANSGADLITVKKKGQKHEEHIYYLNAFGKTPALAEANAHKMCDELVVKSKFSSTSKTKVDLAGYHSANSGATGGEALIEAFCRLYPNWFY